MEKRNLNFPHPIHYNEGLKSCKIKVVITYIDDRMCGEKELRINPKNKKLKNFRYLVEDKSMKIVCGQVCFLISCFFHQSGKMARVCLNLGWCLLNLVVKIVIFLVETHF